MHTKSLFFVWVILLYMNGTWYFLQGFLLSRREIHQKSASIEEPFYSNLSPKYRKVIILIIDALRHDFVSHHNYTTGDEIPIYHNNLPIVHQLLKNDKALIYQFIADPPTTTLQRLKGLMTGSLPTFIDVGSNFASDELLEDNLIDQITSNHLKIIFMGDDTWMGLFPNSFQRSYPFPSFDVWDLDTVDRGVELYLQSEIHRKDWNLLIAHCLGVDHTGHRYGPEHPAMPLKLKEMNALIENIVNKMDPEGLLLVMGDHGMSRSGDHGGDSLDETTAAFFAYSPQWKIKRHEQIVHTVSQVDLVPTLSILLGIPIPYSNLGSVMLELIYPEHILGGETNESFILSYYADALSLNVRQVWRYLLSYNTDSPFPKEDFDRLVHQYDHIITLSKRLNIPGCSASCMEDSKNCPDPKELKIFIQNSQIFLNEVKEMCRSVWARFDLSSIGIGLTIFTSALLLHSASFNTSPSQRNICYGILCIVISSLIRANVLLSLVAHLTPVLIALLRCERLDYPHPFYWVPIILAALYTSNSFVVQEPYIVHYLVQALLWIPFICRRPVDRRQWILRLTLSTTTRLGLLYFRCREEQFPSCETNNLHRSLTSISSSNWIIYGRLFLALLSLTAFHFVWKRFLAGCLISIIGFYWIAQAVSISFLNLEPAVLNYFPQLFYAIFVISMAHLIFNLVSSRFYQNSSSDLVLLFSTLAILLAGDGLAPGTVLTVINIVLMAQVASIPSDTEFLPLYVLLSLHGFFSTGHHTSLANVPWETAFVGFSHSSSPGVLANVLPAFLVSFSTASSLLLHALAIPMVVTSPKMHPGMRHLYLERGKMYFLLFHAIRLFGCLGAAVIHRRHLMVWKIFAPRLLYELLLALYTTFGLIILGLTHRFA